MDGNLMYLRLHDCSRIYKNYMGKSITQIAVEEATGVGEKTVRALANGESKRLACQSFAAISTYLTDLSVELVEAGHIEQAWTLDDMWGWERVDAIEVTRPDMVKPDDSKQE